jgi:two-component system, NtrC family, response regulator HydG
VTLVASILIIDDEESIRFSFSSFLVDAGHTVTTAETLNQASELMQMTTFDVIFADLALGDESGIQVLKERVQGQGQVVIMTGYPSEETASEAKRLGAFDYIPKPVRQETLLASARMALGDQTRWTMAEKQHPGHWADAPKGIWGPSQKLPPKGWGKEFLAID